MKRYEIFVGIGSNLGEKEDNCIAAIKEMGNDQRINIGAASSLYLTSPLSLIEQDDFLNCVVAIEFDGSPFDLLRVLKDIERRMGRKNSLRWGPRIIDLDILLFRDLVIRHQDLSIPHMELHKRKFVLVPLLEIERDLLHPFFKRPLISFLSEIDETQRVKFFKGLKLENIKGKQVCVSLI